MKNELNILKVYKTNPAVSDLKYGSEQAACFDISSFITFQSCVKSYTKNNGLVDILATQDAEGKNYIDIPPEWRVLVPTGIIFDIPDNYCVKIYSRSGLSTKKGLNLINSVGIIDADYFDELFIPIYNNSQEKIRLFSGERIAQGEMAPTIRGIINYIFDKPIKKTDRDGGFGSTGV
jgi:deoxyuridine 5'-triphosphate nucleotidohydrolase